MNHSNFLWGASLLYLLSAGCLLLGATMVIVPIYANPELIIEKLYLVGTLNFYELMLLVVTVLVCKWKRGNDDAVSLTCLLAVFLVGSGIALDTISLDFPKIALGLGGLGLGLAIFKFYMLRRYVLEKLPLLFCVAIAILLLPNFIMPAIMGFCMTGGITARSSLLPIWLGGWSITLSAGILLVIMASLQKNGTLGEDKSPHFLHSTLLRWIITCILLFAAFVHQFTLSCPCDLGLKIGDLLPALGIMVLLLIELRRAYNGGLNSNDIIIAFFPFIAAILVIFTRSYSISFSYLPGLICYPPIFLGIMSFAIGGIAIRKKLFSLYIVATLYLSFAVITYGAAPGKFFYPNWNLLLLLLSIFSIIGTVISRRPSIAMISAIIVSIWFANSSPIIKNVGLDKLGSSSGLMMFSMLIMLIYTIFRKDYLRWLAYLTGFILIVGFLITGMSFIGALSFLLFTIAIGLITNDKGIFFFGIIPGAVTVWTYLPKNKGWLIIFGSFLLLGGGAFISFRKAQKQQLDIEEPLTEESNLE